MFKRRSLAGSLIGGIAETQEMLDFCSEHQIVSDIEMISIDEIDTAFERMLRGDVKYRFVIDMATLRNRMAHAAPAMTSETTASASPNQSRGFEPLRRGL